jgi:hypothetical protein
LNSKSLGINGQYLLREVDGDEGHPPPGGAVLGAHLVEPPVLPPAQLPPFPPEVVVREPGAPQPRQGHRHRRPRRVRLGRRMAPVVVQKQYRDDGPVQVDELQGDIHTESAFRRTRRGRGGETRLGRIGGGEVRVFSYPVVGEDEAEEPEEDVDVEEEEGVGEDERVRGAPGGDRPGVVSPSTHEGHVEEDGRERDEGRDDQVLEGHGSQR